MRRVVHIIGNGGSSFLYNEEKRKGLKLGCNQISFNVPEKYASCIVDYKFMQAMTANEITLPGQWILGFRPKHWMEMNPDYYMKVSGQVKEFYTELPNYAANYTDFNCGHMAAHYSANKLKADEIHLYGFDSIFDFNLNSASDLSLKSDRGNSNNLRLADNWRPIWQSMFKEFSNTKFILHYTHDKLKINIGNNVDVKVYNPKEKEKNISFDQLSEA
tara:strand:+ start:2834 stop:3484 length:651 start_codon:yes stop_codon:yes gene_type:complete